MVLVRADDVRDAAPPPHRRLTGRRRPGPDHADDNRAPVPSVVRTNDVPAFGF
jgi:hypothetical protein